METRRFIEIRDGVAVGDVRSTATFSPDYVAPAGLVEVPNDDVQYLGRPYSAQTKTFGPLPPPPPKRVWALRDFHRLFTSAERIGISQRRTTTDATGLTLDDWYRLLEAGPEVDLRHPDLTAGLDFLVSAGLLTAARKTAILAGATP